MEHYFSKDHKAKHDIVCITERYANHIFKFYTDSGVFSKGKMDKGTRLLLDSLPEFNNEKILDLGCGWGAIGIILAKLYQNTEVHLSDVNSRAISLAKKNAKINETTVNIHKSDGFGDIETIFDVIVTNPPIRAGKKVVYGMVRQSAEYLAFGGSFFSVVRTKQGADSYMVELESAFGNAEIINRGAGYKVFKANKL